MSEVQSKGAIRLQSSASGSKLSQLVVPAKQQVCTVSIILSAVNGELKYNISIICTANLVLLYKLFGERHSDLSNIYK